MKNRMLLPLCVLLCSGAIAQESSDEKKVLRELSPDRPHQTESPITVDFGHVMLETDLVNTTTENKATPNSSTTGLLYFNLKVGIQKNMDFGIMSNGYSFTQYKNHARPSENNMLPDFTFRYKYNIMGNDEGRTAICLMPFMSTTNPFSEKLKTKSAGFYVNAEQMIGKKCDLGYTGGVTAFTSDPNHQYEWFSTLSFGYPIYKTVSHFIEVSERFNKSANEKNNYSVDSGFTFTPTKNNQFDMGFYYFVPVEKLYVFIGTTIRI